MGAFRATLLLGARRGRTSESKAASAGLWSELRRWRVEMLSWKHWPPCATCSFSTPQIRKPQSGPSLTLPTWGLLPGPEATALQHSRPSSTPPTGTSRRCRERTCR